MKKEEIEQELINLAYLRWQFIRESEEYKQAFQEFLEESPGQKDNPLIFKEFEMLPKENIDGFWKRIAKLFKKTINQQLGNGKTINISEYASYTRGSGGKMSFIRWRWGLRPPVAPNIQNPNPTSATQNHSSAAPA